MSSEEVAISVRNVSKHYAMFRRPEDRLKQMVIPRLQRLAGRTPTRYFSHFASLSDVSFDVRRGETIGIVGRNGSGKSTLLQIICGTLQPTAGTVQVNGRIAALLELGAGFNTEFTGRENVYLNATIQGLSQAEIDARFESIAAFADIGQFIDQPVKTYSSGMYVRLAFATAINVDPEILIVDEALAVGDEAFQRKCFARIEDIKEKGGTILFVSHSAQSIVQLCDRALLIDAGELLLQGPPKRVINHYHRLIHCNEEQAAEVRAAIKKMAGSPAADSESEPASTTGEETTPKSSELSDFSWFDPSLVSQSSVEYVQIGAKIENMHVRNAAGQKVNRLTHGCRYMIAYEVTFQESHAKVGFGTLIKTVTGVELGGQHSHSFDEGVRVSAGDKVEVALPFSALLTPGIYFFNAGVRSHENIHSYVQLHRILDGGVFRVDEVSHPRPITGFVNLVPTDEKPIVKILSSGSTGVSKESRLYADHGSLE